MGGHSPLDVIVDLERRYPVEDWSVAGLHVWPMLRIRMFTLLVMHGLGSDPAEAGARSPAERVSHAIKGIGRIARNTILSGNRLVFPSRDDEAVLLADGISFANIEGKWRDRLMDPIIAALEANGRPSLLMTPGYLCPGPRYSPTCHIQSRLDASKVLGTLVSKLKPSPLFGSDSFAAMQSEISRDYPDIAFPGERWLVEQAARIEWMARHFGGIIGKTSARAAFVSNYYGAEGMAFVLAARRAGCVTIDVQHGLQHRHVGYVQWTKIPSGGYDLLPHLFWCWGPDEVHAINQGPGAPWHRGVEIGNFWADFWADPENPVVARTIGRLRSIKESLGAQRHFLLTPSWGYPDIEFEKLFESVRHADPHIHWWLRLHPTLVARREEMRDRVTTLGLGNVEIDAAMDFPLPVLLHEMDANITFDSSTVLDARAAGVPSVVTTSNGAALFAREIEAGFCRFAADPVDIAAAAMQLAEHNPLERGYTSRSLTQALETRIAELFSAGSQPA